MDTKPLYEAAYHLYKGGRYIDAEQFFRLLTMIDVANVDYWMGLGATLQMQKKWQEAVDVYGAAAVLDKKKGNPLPHLYGAQCLHALDDKENALKALKSAKTLCQEDPDFVNMIPKINVLKECWEKPYDIS